MVFYFIIIGRKADCPTGKFVIGGFGGLKILEGSIVHYNSKGGTG